MAEGWKLTARAPKRAVEAALAAQEVGGDWPADWVVAADEVIAAPEHWTFEVYLPRQPTSADRHAIAALFEDAPSFDVKKLPDEDWTVLSQQSVKPIRAGRFHVHTPDHPPSPGAVNFVVPASQAFGTGHHETTAGCLEMLDLMRRQGVVARDIADIGTGTGLLAFAAMRLWPRAFATASDNDPVCLPVVAENARLNAIRPGSGRCELAMLVADGMDHPALQARAPYDLLIANILARPLIELAPDFADAMKPGGQLLLSGLLETQEAEVRRAARRAGFRLARRLVKGDWSILWLRKRRP